MSAMAMAALPAPGVEATDATATSGASWTLYVANWNSETVSPVNTATHAVATAIPVGKSPGGIAITPDGATAFVADFGNSRVTPIDLTTNTALPFIDLGFPLVIPQNIAISPDGTTVFVVATDGGDGVVVPIDVATRTLETFIPVTGNVFSAIAITPDGSTAFATDNGNSEVVPIDLATRTPGTPISVGANPDFPVVTPDGTTVFVSNSGADQVTPIDVATRTAAAPISVSSNPGTVRDHARREHDAPRQRRARQHDHPDRPRDAYARNVRTGERQPIGDRDHTRRQASVRRQLRPRQRAEHDPTDHLTTMTAGALITVGSNPNVLVVTPDQAPVARLVVGPRSPVSPRPSTPRARP